VTLAQYHTKNLPNRDIRQNNINAAKQPITQITKNLAPWPVRKTNKPAPATVHPQENSNTSDNIDINNRRVVKTSSPPISQIGNPPRHKHANSKSVGYTV
jgi:hypothetical protein